MATTSAAGPSTPTNDSSADLKIKHVVSNLCFTWDLGLEVAEGQSPNKLPPLRRDCLAKIKFLCWKKRIDTPLKKFDQEADNLYMKWIRKPKTERGVVPEVTGHKPRPVTDTERDQLLKCLLRILREESQQTPKRSGSLKSFSFTSLDTGPVPFALSPRTVARPKRPSEEGFNDLESISKKMKQPDGTATAEVMLPKPVNNMPPPDRGRPMRKPPTVVRSADTSFASTTSSIFSRQSLGNTMFQNTQETTPDDEESIPTQPNTRASSPIQNQQKSDYRAGSSFDSLLAKAKDANGLLLGTEIFHSHVDEGLSQDFGEYRLEEPAVESVTELISDRVKEAFPTIPDGLKKASFRVIYEITRIFLHADVFMKDLKLPVSLIPDDYDALWEFLKDLPALKGRPFPERCSKQAWNAASGNFEAGFRAVVLAGSLKFTYNPNPEDSLFNFQLQPMKLDMSHRLGRRFGNDRFMEIDVPHFTGRQIPKILQGLGEQGLVTLLDWLIDGTHSMLGRTWKPFHLKSERPKKKKKEESQIGDHHNRVYFFAVTGEGFLIVANPLQDAQLSPPRYMMSVQAMLDLVRPTRKNKEQSFLKFFARTDLAVSRNSATVVLERSQIIHKKDIQYNGEVMTDGAGRISPTLALKITQMLGLSYPPSGFQARIGEAKGFWSVNFNYKGSDDWIEVYDSQRKWSRSRKPEHDHLSHRTFEVLRFSGPLKSADLNLQFLPILTGRARDRRLMTIALSRLLEGGLERELMELQNAMADGQSFRKWIRDSNSGINERLKSGAVPYRAGLPVTTDERLNMVLDAGFEPKNLYFMKDLARKAFKSKCEELKNRLNITVAKSTYAYMVPDFAGVLEPDEVYIDFSSFVDDMSGFSGVLLNGVDVLVARSPAHFVSDIQKVKAVMRVELLGLKDVIVFPTKGNPSLAAKLSGGDYDGDIAWVCWEPEIVNNFVNANVPEVPDLVQEGFIHENTAKYRELVEGQSDPTSSTSKFLKESFKFNMQQSMLGVCTVFKDDICYAQGSVDTPESVYLSTLLSSLVDQAKQGYIFTEEHWDRFKKTVIKIQPKQPSYKTDRVDPHSKHIIDQLMIVASKAIEKALTEFHVNVADPPFFDPDLVIHYNWARECAESEPEWKALLEHLDDDIKILKQAWHEDSDKSRKKQFDRSMSGGFKDEAINPEYMIRVERFYDQFQTILPHVNTPLTQALLPKCLPDQELSSWALLRASALFSTYGRASTSRFPWFMAGKQLTTLKVIYRGGGFPPAVTPGNYAMLKPDAAYVKKLRVQRNRECGVMEENMSVTNADELEDLED